MTELEERVIALIVEQTGVKRKNIQLASRVADDIGMEGDDAVEFFEEFGKEFNVNLTSLGNHWHQHFLPEGGGVPPGCMVVMGAGLVAGMIVHEIIRWIPVWLSMPTLVVVFCWIYVRFFVERHEAPIPVTVQDIVDSAIAGTWVKSYDEAGGTSPEDSQRNSVPLFRTLD